MSDRGHDPSDGSHWRALRRDPVLVGIALWSIVVLLLAVARPDLTRVLAVALLPVDAVFAWSAWRVHRQASGPMRRFWRIAAYAGVLLVVGDMFQVRAFCLAAGLLAVTVAMLILPDKGNSAGVRLASWLDATTVLVGGAAVSWCFIIAPARGPEAGGRTIAVGIALLAAFAAVRMTLSGTVALHGIAAVPLVAATATVFLPAPAPGVLGLAVLLPTPLIAAGARLQEMFVRQPVAARRHRHYGLLPYGAVVAAFATLILVLADDDGTRRYGAVAGAAAVTALVVARQILAFRDNAVLIGRLREHEQRLSRQASSDGLTGLANRAFFTERVAQALGERAGVTLLLIDLDNFKTVNDTMGHATGDALLVGIADCLRAAVRSGDVVARLGGDEFAVLLGGGPGERAERIADRIIASIADHVRTGKEAMIGASVGVASAGPDDDVESLMSAADIAMYAAKARGRGTQVSYTPDLRARVQHQADLATKLAAAFGEKRLYVVYQPIVRLDDGGLVGVEALVRWRSDFGPPVMPGEFIPVAEDSGLIVEIGRFVMYTACWQAASWRRDDPTSDLTISVNVTGRQLRDPGFVGDVAAILRDVELPADCLTIEVTETAVFDDDIALRTLHELRALGTRLALDDFGTAASSLGLLLTCPITSIKLDRSFVESITTVDRQAAVARAVGQIAETLQLSAVAEGIETEEQATMLRGMGYQLGQGYLYSRPVSAEDIEQRFLNEAIAARA